MNAVTSGIPLAVLVTLSERPHLHVARTIPSLLSQTTPWDMLCVVDDFAATTSMCGGFLAKAGLPRADFIRNTRLKGAAGAWNSGLRRIREVCGDAWVAILDDEDIWEANHLSACLSNSHRALDAVISGIAPMAIGMGVADFSTMFSRREFLSGNPGWQGSNTFVRLGCIEKVGGFDESLPCTHDRDLALRLMALPGFSYVRTGQRTVWYMMDDDLPAYTRRGNPVKLDGLRSFLRKYRDEMNPEDLEAFLERSETLFGFGRDCFGDIL